VSSAEENKALARRFLEAGVNNDLETLHELLAPDFVDRSLLPGQESDREGYMRSFVELNAPLSDRTITIDHQVAEGDKVVTWFTGSITHDRGPFMGLPPTGNRYTFEGAAMHTVVGSKIAEEWSLTDWLTILLTLLKQEISERERIEQELQVARSIQQASLPKEVPAPEDWQISPFYQPAREVGGDYFDFFEFGDGRLGVVVGDATGKGVPAALVMASTRSMLRAVAQALGSSSPGNVLARVNDSLVTDIPANMFVTCFYCILDPRRGSLTYANAGHDLPYVRRSGGDCEELRARGMPLGLMSGTSYEENEVVLDAGEAALFYSDGLVEAHDPEGEMFGFPRLQALVSEHGEEERSLEEALLEELYSFVGEGWEQEDDITLLTLRRSASP
jgi:serine phosphatase RsbU (regulator of sigma subunit)